MKFLVLISLFCALSSFGQTNTVKEKQELTIQEQFDAVYKISRTYQYFKVVNIDRYNTLKKNTLDSLNSSKNNITLLTNEVKNLKSTNSQLNANNIALNKSYKEAVSKNNDVSLLGLKLSFNTYNFMIWLLVLLFAGGMGYFLKRYLGNNEATKDAIENLTDVEKEFEQFRKKSLEREQKLRRQLHDATK